MMSSQLSRALLVVFIALTWKESLTDFRCYSDSCDTMFLSADNARQCCIDLVDGITYDYGANLEVCYSCEVLGWREENVYAMENSRLQLFFGAVKGSVSEPYMFRVDISGNANISVISDIDLGRIMLRAVDVGFEVQVPRSPAGARALNRTATLRLTQLFPAAMADGQFVHPAKMTLHVIVPEVQFEHNSYTLRFPHSSFSVCLLYNNTEEGGYAQFEIEVSIQNSAGGNFSLLESFNFTRLYGTSCRNISIPHSELGPLTDAVFTADIVVPAEPVFELGAVSSASLTVEAIEPPQVQFQRPAYSVRYPESTIPVCLIYTSPDAVYVTFEAEITLSKGSDVLQSLSYQFTDTGGRSCRNITLPRSELKQFRDIKFVAAIDVQPNTIFDRGDVSIANVTVEGLEVPRVEFERSSYQDAVFPDDTVPAATVPVCLVYNDTGSEVYGQFDVVVELTKIGEGVILTQTFHFSNDGSRSCEDIQIHRSNLSQFSDTVFSAGIVIPPESEVELGDVSTSLITVQGIDAPRVEFQQSSYVVQSPAVTVTVCLLNDIPEGGGVGFAVNVSVTNTKGRGVLTHSYKFAENDSISCQNITILRSELNPFGDTVFHLSIQTLAEPLLQVGPVSSAEITIVGKPEPTVEVKPEPTQGGEEPDKGSGKDGEDNTEEEGTKEGAKEDEVAVQSDASYLKKDSNNSGTPSWVIAISVVLPLILVAIAITTVIVTVTLYKRDHYTSYTLSRSRSARLRLVL